jgi:hypothetical protein
MKKIPPLRYETFNTHHTIAAATGCSLATAKRWHSLGDAMPPMALRLVNYYTRLDLSAVFGRDWHKFGIYQGRLVCDLFPDGITPTQLRKLFFLAQDNQLLENMNRMQYTALAAVNRRCEVLARDNAFFREQYRQEKAQRDLRGGGCF